MRLCSLNYEHVTREKDKLADLSRYYAKKKITGIKLVQLKVVSRRYKCLAEY